MKRWLVIFVMIGWMFGMITLTEAQQTVQALPADSSVMDMLDLKNMDILDVLKLISQKSGLNIVASDQVKGRVTVYLKNIDVEDALKIILESNDWVYVKDDDVVKVMTNKQYEETFGHKFGQKMESRMIYVDHIIPSEVATVLGKLKGKDGEIVTDDKSQTIILTDEAKYLTKMESLIARMDKETNVAVIQLNYAKAEDVAKKVEEELTPALGTVRFDERSNKLIVSDSALKLEKIKQLVEAFDQKDQEVLIEAKIIQIVLTNEHKLGVDWEGIVADYHNLDFKSNFDVLGATDKQGKVSIGTLTDDNYTAMIEALDSIGETKLLSSPRITAVHNKEAKILVGSNEPYVTTTTTTPSAGPTTTAESVNFVEVGVKLYVTPQIHRDGFISMEIKPEVSSVVKSITTSNNNSIPVVETSEASTSVIVKDGTTIVIGGLIKEEEIFYKKSVPLFGSLPIIGGAFRSETKEKNKTEIVIFLTPKIITGDVGVVE